MDKLQEFLGSVGGLLRERSPLLLPNQARVTELVHAINGRKTANHGLPRESAECLEVEVPVARVPEPARLAAARRQAHRAGDVEVEVVKPVGRPCDLRDESAIVVVEAQNAILDDDLHPGVDQLPNADDVGSETRDVVDAGECTVFAGLAREQYRAAPLDVHQ